MPGKRSNPAKLRRARLQNAYENSDPETQAIVRPTIPGMLSELFGGAIQRRRERRNPVPDIRGATVIGTKKYRGIT